MSGGDYLLGLTLTVAIAAALGFGAYWTRARLLPVWVGAPARLVELVLAIGTALVAAQLLGAIGLFSRWWVALTLVAAGLGGGRLARRAAARGGVPDPPSAPPVSRVATGIGLLAGALVAAQWFSHVVAAYAGGMFDGDTTWYHLPFATHFVQEHSLTGVLFTNFDTLVTYFPANSELTGALTILPFGNDVLVPLLNIAWLALALLAGWCLGRPFGAAPAGLAAVAVSLSLPVMASTQAGTGRNDVVAVALFLATTAIVLHARWDPAAIGVAALAAGLAIGVKLSSVLPVVLLAVGVLVVMPREHRRRAGVTWAVVFVLVGSYWYLRNLVIVGNPLPFTAIDVGPVHLPSPLTTEIAPSIVDRVGEPGIFSDVFFPGFEDGFGPLWWLVALLFAAGAVLALTGSRDRVVRMLGAVALAAAVAYAFTPNSAPGEGIVAGANFLLNLRYVALALALGLALLPASRWLAGHRAQLGLVTGLTAIVVVDQFPRELQRGSWEWPLDTTDTAVGLAVGAALLVGAALVIALRDRPRLLLGSAVTVVVALVLAGWWGQRDYFDARYATPRAGLPASAAFPWAQTLAPTRIALAGNFFQYPLAGPRLGTRVRFVGREVGDGGFRVASSCREWRRALADGAYRYVVAAPSPIGFDAPEVQRAVRWTRSIPGATRVLRQDATHVYRLDKRVDGRGCP